MKKKALDISFSAKTEIQFKAERPIHIMDGNYNDKCLNRIAMNVTKYKVNTTN